MTLTQTLTELLDALKEPKYLDLDRFREKIEGLEERFRKTEELNRLYESALQNELRARIELVGGTPGCPEPETAVKLHGENLLAARRGASEKFNRLFYMEPLSRRAATRKPEAPPAGAKPLTLRPPV